MKHLLFLLMIASVEAKGQSLFNSPPTRITPRYRSYTAVTFCPKIYDRQLSCRIGVYEENKPVKIYIDLDTFHFVIYVPTIDSLKFNGKITPLFPYDTAH